MKTRLLVFILTGAFSMHAQTTAPSATTAVPAAADAAPGYPDSPQSAMTTKAGILGLRATDIPRYTQTGLVPDSSAGHGVTSPSPRDPKLPTIWTIGDSTVRTGIDGDGADQPGQWGWGCPFVGYFDLWTVNVVNRAVGGTTAMSFYQAQWRAMVDMLKKGDVVILQFGTNSAATELHSNGDEEQEVTGRNGQPTIARSFGWYIRQFIAETRARGATPVVCSLIPRNRRDANGKTVRDATSQAGWAKEAAAQMNADFIDLNELVSRKYDTMDKVTVDALFDGSPHTSWTGAIVNAETVISGLKALKDDPAAAYYVDAVKKIAPAPDLSIPAPAAANSTAK